MSNRTRYLLVATFGLAFILYCVTWHIISKRFQAIITNDLEKFVSRSAELQLISAFKVDKVEAYGFPFVLGYRLFGYEEENPNYIINAEKPIELGYEVIRGRFFLKHGAPSSVFLKEEAKPAGSISGEVNYTFSPGFLRGAEILFSLARGKEVKLLGSHRLVARDIIGTSAQGEVLINQKLLDVDCTVQEKQGQYIVKASLDHRDLEPYANAFFIRSNLYPKLISGLAKAKFDVDATVSFSTPLYVKASYKVLDDFGEGDCKLLLKEKSGDFGISGEIEVENVRANNKVEEELQDKFVGHVATDLLNKNLRELAGTAEINELLKILVFGPKSINAKLVAQYERNDEALPHAFSVQEATLKADDSGVSIKGDYKAKEIDGQRFDPLGSIKGSLILFKPSSILDCVTKLARLAYDITFNMDNNIDEKSRANIHAANKMVMTEVYKNLKEASVSPESTDDSMVLNFDIDSKNLASSTIGKTPILVFIDKIKQSIDEASKQLEQTDAKR